MARKAAERRFTVSRPFIYIAVPTISAKMCDLDTVPTNHNWLQMLTCKPGFLSVPLIAGAYAMNSSDGRFQWSVGRRICPICLGSTQYIRQDCAATAKFSCPTHQQAEPVYFFDNRLSESWTPYDVAGFGNFAIHRDAFDKAGPFEFRDEREHGKTEDICFFEDTQLTVWTHGSLVCEHWRITEITQQLLIQSNHQDQIQELMGKVQKATK